MELIEDDILLMVMLICKVHMIHLVTLLQLKLFASVSLLEEDIMCVPSGYSVKSIRKKTEHDEVEVAKKRVKKHLMIRLSTHFHIPLFLN